MLFRCPVGTPMAEVDLICECDLVEHLLKTVWSALEGRTILAWCPLYSLLRLFQSRMGMSRWRSCQCGSIIFQDGVVPVMFLLRPCGWYFQQCASHVSLFEGHSRAKLEMNKLACWYSIVCFKYCASFPINFYSFVCQHCQKRYLPDKTDAIPLCILSDSVDKSISTRFPKPLFVNIRSESNYK